MTRTVNVGMIGYRFMGKAHSHAYHDVGMFFPSDVVPVKKVICGRTRSAVEEAARVFGWQEAATDWEAVVSRPDIDIIDINTPNHLHRDIAIAAARHGKAVFCEKPLAMDAVQAREMLDAVRAAKVKHLVAFNYRMVPALALAKRLIDEGRIGVIRHFRAVYLQDWICDPSFPCVWRLQKELAGSGVHGDLNAHLIDLARWLVGEFDRVVGMSETFVTERPCERTGGGITTGLEARSDASARRVTVDDATLFLARFKNGALGSFESTRMAPGRRNGQRIEINGSRGSIVFEQEDMNILWYYSQDDDKSVQGFKRIQVTEAVHPFTGAWWPAGHIIGYEHTFVHLVKELLDAIAQDRMPSPDFEDGFRCQVVLDAVMESARSGGWVAIRE